MFFVKVLKGTCIGHQLELKVNTVFPKTPEELMQAIQVVTRNIPVIITRKKDEEFRKVLIETGFKSYEGQEGVHTHFIDPVLFERIKLRGYENIVEAVRRGADQVPQEGDVCLFTAQKNPESAVLSCGSPGDINMNEKNQLVGVRIITKLERSVTQFQGFSRGKPHTFSDTYNGWGVDQFQKLVFE